jgi:hypothetical protein
MDIQTHWLTKKSQYEKNRENLDTNSTFNIDFTSSRCQKINENIERIAEHQQPSRRTANFF